MKWLNILLAVFLLTGCSIALDEGPRAIRAIDSTSNDYYEAHLYGFLKQTIDKSFTFKAEITAKDLPLYDVYIAFSGQNMGMMCLHTWGPVGSMRYALSAHQTLSLSCTGTLHELDTRTITVEIRGAVCHLICPYDEVRSILSATITTL